MSLYAKGKKVLASINHALAIICNDKDGNKSNVQKELDNLYTRPVNNNILINSNFANPVNQRGVTAETWVPTASGTPTYGLDRWVTGSTVVSIDGGLTLKKKDDPNGHYTVQKIESNYMQPGKKYTFSACVDGKVYSGTATALLESEQTNTVTFFENDAFRFAYQYASCWHIYFILKDNNEHTVTWIKLEEGDCATPYIPRLYDEEWQLCQRYYQMLNNIVGVFAFAYSATTILYRIYFSRMRITPTPTIYMINGISSSNAGTNASSASVTNITDCYAEIHSTFPVNMLTYGNSSRINISLDAEL